MSFTSMLRWVCVAVLACGVFTIPVVQKAEAASTSTGCLPGALRSRLAQIRSKFGSVRVLSTHRPGARIAGSGRRSFHASCRAVDFKPPAGKYGAVVRWLKANHGGGVGTYSCGMHHIHIDNGPRIRFHHCVSASGRPVRYARKSRSRKRYAGRRQKTTWRSVARNSSGAASRSRARSVQTADKSFATRRFLRGITRDGG